MLLEVATKVTLAGGMQGALEQRPCSVSGSDCRLRERAQFGNPTQHSILKILVSVFTNYIIYKVSREPYEVQSTVPATVKVSNNTYYMLLRCGERWGIRSSGSVCPCVSPG